MTNKTTWKKIEYVRLSYTRVPGIRVHVAMGIGLGVASWRPTPLCCPPSMTQQAKGYLYMRACYFVILVR